MDYSPPGSSVHGIPQARTLEWVAISFSRGSSWYRDWASTSCIGRRILYHLATRKAFSWCLNNTKVVKDIRNCKIAQKVVMYLVIVSFKNLEINNSAYYFLQDRSYLFDYFKNGLSLKSVFQRPSSQLGMILLPGRYLAMRHLWSLQLGNEMVLLASTG